MTLEEFYAEFSEISYKGRKIPLAYYEFDVNEELATPYMAYFAEDVNSLHADNVNYVDIDNLVLELYTTFRDKELEKVIEELFKKHDISYEASYTYITQDKIQLKLYQFSLS